MADKPLRGFFCYPQLTQPWANGKMLEMLEKFQAKYTQFKSWYLRKKVIRNFRKQNHYSLEVEKLMEQYATQQVLSGKSSDSVSRSRQVLLKHQETIRVKEDFQDFLEKLK